MKSSSLAPHKILLVDDCRDGLLVRSALLREAGYSVEVAENGEQGLKLYQSSNFDVVVTDYRMPRMDGVEFIGHLRKINPNARVVLLSGFVEPLGLNEENTGADAVVAKSCKEVTQLQRVVKRLANRLTSRKPPVQNRRFRQAIRLTGT